MCAGGHFIPAKIHTDRAFLKRECHERQYPECAMLERSYDMHKILTDLSPGAGSLDMCTIPAVTSVLYILLKGGVLLKAAPCILHTFQG
jgi:hypothetical protein